MASTAQDFINHYSQISNYKYITKTKQGVIQLHQCDPAYMELTDRFQHIPGKVITFYKEQKIFNLPYFPSSDTGKCVILKAENR